MDKARQCSETLVPFKADAVLETEGGISVFRYMLTDFSLDPQGPTLVLLDSQGILTQHRLAKPKRSIPDDDCVFLALLASRVLKEISFSNQVFSSHLFNSRPHLLSQLL